MADTVLPFNDEAMTYDLTKHMYVLNEDYVVNSMGIDLLRLLKADEDPKRSSIVKRYLDRISMLVYNFIYSHCRNDIKDYVEFMLAKRENWREYIQQALEEQLIYVTRNGDLTTYNGIDLYKGTKLQIKREDTISPNTKDILSNGDILYTGYYIVPINFSDIKRSDY